VRRGVRGGVFGGSWLHGLCIAWWSGCGAMRCEVQCEGCWRMVLHGLSRVGEGWCTGCAVDRGRGHVLQLTGYIVDASRLIDCLPAQGQWCCMLLCVMVHVL
jgi:hypothetical protein